ncbi:MAG: hypothetical protein L0Y72_02540 [Gemmataceae bacterium]|nr:hypothetical protein [Gemmataceae bacterium]MCI0737895.1 hypothetical protein [Gemmataceae bacterium]
MLRGFALLCLAMVVGGSAAQERVQQSKTATKAFDLQEDGKLEFKVTFAKGKRVFLRVDSEQESDVDLFVDDPNDVEVASDDRVHKNCLATFVPKTTQEYKITIDNLGPGANKGKITYGEDLFKITQEIKPFDINEGQTKAFELKFEKGKPAYIFVESEMDSDVDLFVKDKDGNEVVKDDSGNPSAAGTWTPQYSGVFRIEVVNLGEGANRCQILIAEEPANARPMAPERGRDRDRK